MVFEISEPSMAGHLKKRRDQCFLSIQIKSVQMSHNYTQASERENTDFPPSN